MPLRKKAPSGISDHHRAGVCLSIYLAFKTGLNTLFLVGYMQSLYGAIPFSTFEMLEKLPAVREPAWVAAM